MTEAIKTNRLNVYLLKKGYTNHQSVIKMDEEKEIKQVKIPGVGVLFYKKSNAYHPDWLEDFFLNHKSINKNHFYSSGTNAVLIVHTGKSASGRFFAIPFGSGRFLVRDNAFEERFGLISALNMLEADRIRSMDKRTLATNQKNTREQVAKAGSATDFGVDFENDLLQSITGKTFLTDFGNIVTGRDALSISAKINIDNLVGFLKSCLTVYNKKDYKVSFGWVDQLKEIRDETFREKLDKMLVDKIKVQDAQVWLAVPEIIDWPDVKGFKYSLRKKDECFGEIDIDKLLEQAWLDDDFTAEQLKKNFISCWSNSKEEYVYRWSVYLCLNAELEIKDRKFMLANGKWFEINKNFVNEINNAFRRIIPCKINLPHYNHKDENDYNEAVAKSIKGLCLDGQNLVYGGGRSKIEFCDVLDKKKHFIHCKKYAGSSVLSHLFNQGFVSGQLLIADERFRRKVQSELLTTPFKKMVPVTKPRPEGYHIVYVIIGDKGKGKFFNIPFFSKITLRRCVRDLEAYGYKVYLNLVPNKKN